MEAPDELSAGGGPVLRQAQDERQTQDERQARDEPFEGLSEYPDSSGFGVRSADRAGSAESRAQEQRPRHEVTEVEAAALVVRYQAGDTEALARLHGRLDHAIASFLRRYRLSDLPAPVSPHDLTQQSWIILAEIATRWRPRGSFLAYFFRSFPREVQRYVQRARPTQRTRQAQLVTLPHDDLIDQADRLEGEGGPTEAAVLWRIELASLSPRLRAAFLLRSVDGCDFLTIGRALGVSRATAHRLYRSALAQLEVILDLTHPRLGR